MLYLFSYCPGDNDLCTIESATFDTQDDAYFYAQITADSFDTLVQLHQVGEDGEAFIGQRIPSQGTVAL